MKIDFLFTFNTKFTFTRYILEYSDQIETFHILETV